MLNRIRNNAGLKVLSVALALGAWWYLRFTPNPVIAAHFDQQLSVPIVTTGLPADEVARFGEKEAVITIVTPRDSAVPVRPDDVRAVLKLEGRAPGVHSVPLTVIAPKLEVKNVLPSSVTLQVSRMDTRLVKVAVRYVGDPRNVVAQSVRLIPDSASLRGASDDLARIAGVRVDVAFPARPGVLDTMLKPLPTDLRGDDVSGLLVAPNFVRVRATFAPAQHGA